MPGSIIVFSGVDGAGKTTQIKALADRLRARGERPVVLWSRGGYTPGMSRLKSLARWGSRGRAMPAPGPSEARTQAFSRPGVRRWWLRLAILDLVLLYGFWLRALRLAGRDVICDRYLSDTALDFQLNFPDETVSKWWLWRLLVWITPVPELSFLMLIPVDEALRRSQRKHEPFPDSPAILTQRWRAYRRWCADSHWHVLDGTRPLPELTDEIDVAVRGCRREVLEPSA